MRRVLSVAVLALALLLGALPAQAFWTTTTAAGGYGAAAATTVATGATPTVAVSGSTVTVSWAASTLANGQAVAGYEVGRYQVGQPAVVTPGAGCSGRVAALTCAETSVPDGSWRYTVTPVVGTSWRGGESAQSSTAVVDTVAPGASVAVTPVAGGAVRSGANVYYRGVASGSFTLTNTVTDAGSGPASSSTAALGGTTTGWTHSPSTVSTPAGGPFASAGFSWTAGTTSSPTETVTARDAVGLTATTALTFVNDSTGPATGTLTYPNGAAGAASVSVAFAAGADAGSGLASVQLQRAVATLTNGACGSFGSFTDLGAANATSPYVDSAVANGRCYQYRHVATDRVGNTTTTTSARVTKVDYAAAVLATAGLVSAWRLGDVRGGTFGSDTFSATAGTTLQSHAGLLGETWVKHTISSSDAVFTAGGRLRKGAAATTSALYYTSVTPATPDYAVTTSVRLVSVVTNDNIGVVGRLNTGAPTGTFYGAVYERANARWALYSVVSGSPTLIGSSTSLQPTVGASQTLTLDMRGTSIKLIVNGTTLVTATSNSIAAAGRAGVVLGFAASAASTTITDTTGMQLESFSAVLAKRAFDAKGGNHGEYLNGAALNTGTPLTNDADGSTLFDGVDDAMQVASPTSLPIGATARSVEVWLRTSSTAKQVVYGYGTATGDGQAFGLWLDAGGSALTAYGGGTGQDKVFTPSSSLSDGAWHQVVTTYDGTSITVYVDGAALPAQAATRSTVLDATGIGLGGLLGAGGSVGSSFNGLLDEVSVYSVALSAATVAGHYGLGLAH